MPPICACTLQPRRFIGNSQWRGCGNRRVMRAESDGENMRFADAFREAPLAAILRGISPVDVLATCDALHRAGVRVVEVPLNSPDALESVRLVAGTFANMLVCGAGTVLQAADVDRVKAAGGEIIVSPNTNRQVIHRARALDLIAMPGFVTATEAFEAYDAGARYLKLFPASTFGTAYLKQLLA